MTFYDLLKQLENIDERTLKNTNVRLMVGTNEYWNLVCDLDKLEKPFLHINKNDKVAK